MSVAIKICCISDRSEAELAIAEGATVLGFVGEAPLGPGRLPDETIAALIAAVGGRVPCWLLTAHVALDDLIDQIERTRPDAVQLCALVSSPIHTALRERFPSLQLVQVVHVHGPEALQVAQRVAPRVDALLLDSGSEGKLGGTGQVHDWSLSTQIVESASVPVWLAGGLTPHNVAQAITQVRPAGVDLCSGVRDSSYKLDPVALRAFIHRALRAGGPVQIGPNPTVAELQRSVLLLEARMGWLEADLIESGFLMVEEVGELHAAIRALRRAQARGEDLTPYLAAAGAEIADVLNYLLAIANRLGVDVAQASREKNLKNQERTWD
ncbi:MAG: hypothetical protein EA397_02785 [Deltaproteobacteria bacterium]|nr:MAG: hypothetical protein EA397_02785 [Deltaproteobacteria bacterium]